MRKRRNFTTNIELPNIEYKYKHWRCMGLDVFTIYSYQGAGWVRVFGKGICWRDTTKKEGSFSERMGLTKFYTIGKYAIRRIK